MILQALRRPHTLNVLHTYLFLHLQPVDISHWDPYRLFLPCELEITAHYSFSSYIPKELSKRYIELSICRMKEGHEKVLFTDQKPFLKPHNNRSTFHSTKRKYSHVDKSYLPICDTGRSKKETFHFLNMANIRQLVPASETKPRDPFN